MVLVNKPLLNAIKKAVNSADIGPWVASGLDVISPRTGKRIFQATTSANATYVSLLHPQITDSILDSFVKVEGELKRLESFINQGSRMEDYNIAKDAINEIRVLIHAQ
jgi:hypothetical protein